MHHHVAPTLVPSESPTTDYYSTTSMPSYSSSSSLSLAPTHQVTWPQLVFFVTYWGFINANGVNVRDMRSSKALQPPSTVLEDLILPSSSQTFTHQDSTTSSSHQAMGSSRVLTNNGGGNVIQQREPLTNNNNNREEIPRGGAINEEGSNKNRQQGNDMEATSLLEPSTGFPPPDTGWNKHHPPLHSIATPSLTVHPSLSQSEVSITPEGTTTQFNSDSSVIREDQIIDSDFQSTQRTDSLNTDTGPTSSSLVSEMTFISDSKIYDSSVLLVTESTEQVEAETPRPSSIVAMTTVQDDLRHTSSVAVHNNNDFVRHHQPPYRHDGGARRAGAGEGDQRGPQKHEDVSVASIPGASSSNIVNSEVPQVSQTTPIVTEASVSRRSTVKTLLSQPLSTVTEISSPSVTVSNKVQSQLSQVMSTASLVSKPMSTVSSTPMSVVSNDNIGNTLLSMPKPTVTVSALTEGLTTDGHLVSPSVSQPVTEPIDIARIDIKPLEASRYPDDNILSSITKPNIEQSSSGPTKTTHTSSSQGEGIHRTQTLEPSVSDTSSVVEVRDTSSFNPTYSPSGLTSEGSLNNPPEVSTPQLPVLISSYVSEVVSWESSASLYTISTSGGASVRDTQTAEPPVPLNSDLVGSLTGQLTGEIHLHHTQTTQYGTVIGRTQSPPIMGDATYSAYTVVVPTIITEWEGTISSHHPSVHSPSSSILPQASTGLPEAAPSLHISSQLTLAPKSLLPSSSSSRTASGKSYPGSSTPVTGVAQAPLSSPGSTLIHPTEINRVPLATASPTHLIQEETRRVSQTNSVYLGDSETRGFSSEKGQPLQTLVSSMLSPSPTVHTQQTRTVSRPTPEGSASIEELDLFPTSPLPTKVTLTAVHVPPESASQQPEVSTPASIATVPMTTAVSDLVVRVTSAAVTWQDGVVSKEDQLGTSTGSHDTTLPLVTSAAVTRVTPSPQGVWTKRGDNSYVTKTAKGSRSKGPVTSPRPSMTTRMTSMLLSAMTTVPARRDTPSVYVTFKLRMTWTTFCSRIEEFKRVLMGILNKSVHGYYKLVVGDMDECSNVKNVARRSVEITVDVYLADNKGHYNITLTSKFARRINRRVLDQSPGSFKGKFIKVYVVGLDVSNNLLAKQKERTSSMTTPMVAAIVVPSVVFSLILALIITQMVIIGKRRSVKKMRTVGYDSARPSVDVHSLEESIQMISIATMASGLSYTNPAMDSDENKDYTSNPLTLAGLQELLTDPDNEDIEDEFLMLPNPMPKISEVPEGLEDKNRYANVIPIRETRVPLVMRPGSDHSEYINANFVRGYGGKSRMYIATQAPMENTRMDFWEMIWQQQTQVILMLTGIEENGHSKCAEYWPNTEGSDVVRIYGDYHVQLQLRDVTSFWIRSVLVLKNMETNLRREVQHLWLTTWPPSGVPEDPCVVLAFLEAAEPYIQRSHGPPVVHCSPGTGRTGTVLAVDIGRRAWDLTHRVDVLQTVRQLREDRAGAIQTKEQYNFVYKTLLEHTLRVSDPSTASMTSSLISEPA